jgi:hypothetical protein
LVHLLRNVTRNYFSHQPSRFGNGDRWRREPIAEGGLNPMPVSVLDRAGPYILVGFSGPWLKSNMISSEP